MISKMPTVLTMSKITNHHLEDSRADFHKAMPFQIKDHTNNTTTNHAGALSHGVACDCESKLVNDVPMPELYQTFCRRAILLYTFNMTYLGIDFGSKRIGLSVSDPSGSFAMPLSVIENSENAPAEICRICRDRKIDAIVMGESRDFQMNENEVMKGIKIFAEKLKKESGLPVAMHPEFLSSQEARRLQGKNRLLDASAAAIILKSYLDTENNKK
jgi:putative Holliday junction resolvase